MILGEYYQTKCRETGYNDELKQCIESACEYCIDNMKSTVLGNPYYKGEHPLMLLGEIQSGKTRAFTGLMALAFDNGFDYVFILTKNNKALVEQTYKRMRKEFKTFIDQDKVDVTDIMKLQDELTPCELDKKLIIIAKKQKDNLHRISSFIKYTMTNGEKNCLIIDDEADTASIGYEKVKDTMEDFNLRTVAAEVDKIRGSLDGCAFVQVTATPYALYLQPDFEGMEIKPIKPLKTVLVPSGGNYIGGEYYFLKSNNVDSQGRFIFEEVCDEEQEVETGGIGMELIFDRVSKQYREKIAVDRVSLSLSQGVYGLLGANGAGKTTLMRMMCGVLRPDSGEIRYNGMDVGEELYRDVVR